MSFQNLWLNLFSPVYPKIGWLGFKIDRQIKHFYNFHGSFHPSQKYLN